MMLIEEGKIMKHIFNPNKFNIFTKIPDNHNFNVTKYVHTNNRHNNELNLNSVVRNKCIDSWKNIPNTDIHVFTTQDIKDTFPGLLDNDPFYQITVHAPIGSNNIPVMESVINGSEINFHKSYTVPPRVELGFSTDIIRYKMAKKIPNAIYIDSDIYIFDSDKLFKEIINCSEKNALLFCNTQCFYAKNDIFYNTMIGAYDEFVNKYKNCVAYDIRLLECAKLANKNSFDNHIEFIHLCPTIYHFSRTKSFIYHEDMINFLSYEKQCKETKYNYIYVRDFKQNEQNLIPYISKHNIKNTIFFLEANIYNPNEKNELISTINKLSPNNKFYFIDDDLSSDKIRLTNDEIKDIIIFKFKTFYNINIENICFLEF